MLRPSTAPRWKIVIKVLRRPVGVTLNPSARATRRKNEGALVNAPTLASASAPCFIKNLRLLFITHLKRRKP